MNEINRSPTFWRSFPIFEEFDKNTIAELADIATYRKWPAGTVIFQRGDEGNYMIVVISGRIKLSLITPQGRELMLRQHEAGAIFGEMAVLDGQTRSADATAMTASEGYVIGKKAFLDIVTNRPEAAEAVIRPAPDDAIEAYPVTGAVNRTANDTPNLMEPLTGPEPEEVKPAPKRAKREKVNDRQGSLF